LIIDKWKIIDFLMFLQMIVLMLDLHKRFFGEGKVITFIEPKLGNTIFHSAMLILIWVKFGGVLITFQKTGPLISIMHKVSNELYQFVVIFIGSVLVFACIFSVLYHKIYDYRNLFWSFISVYSAANASFSLEYFLD
jgi:hypothetical protein